MWLFHKLYFKYYLSYWTNILGIYIILQTQAGIDKHFTEYLGCFSSSFI